MSNPITDLLTGGFSGVVGSISDILGKFIASPDDKLKAQIELSKIASDYQTQVLLADKDMAVQQASVITTEAKSESWLARNWRPMIMTEFGVILGYNFILAPMFSLTALPIPPDMWELLKLGIGGYIIGRSAEKIVPATAAAIKGS